jgi:hypothetical protein
VRVKLFTSPSLCVIVVRIVPLPAPVARTLIPPLVLTTSNPPVTVVDPIDCTPSCSQKLSLVGVHRS